MGQPKILSPAATAQENHDQCLPEPGVKVYGKRVIYNAASRRPPHKESPMIGVYAGVSVKPEHVEEFLKTIEPLVTASRQDEGNVSYDFGAVSDTDFAFIERWESQELLEKHMGAEHFQKAVAAWEPLLSSELDVRIVNFR
jgi:conserved hypothetical protein